MISSSYNKNQIEQFNKKYVYLEEIDLLGFIWEFIRRNQEYQKAYKLNKTGVGFFFKKDLSLTNKDISKLDFFLNRESNVSSPYSRFVSPFGLVYPIDPSKKSNNKSFKSIPLTYYFKWHTKIINMSWTEMPRTSTNQKKSVELLIDLYASFDKTLPEVKEIVENARKMYEKHGFEKDKKMQFRKEVLIDCLKAYDLKYQKRFQCDVDEIAKIIYAGASEATGKNDNTESVLKRTDRLVKKAERLIDKKAYKEFLP